MRTTMTLAIFAFLLAGCHGQGSSGEPPITFDASFADAGPASPDPEMERRTLKADDVVDTDEELPPPEPQPDIVVSDIPCETDADCVPAECCHATSCVAAEDAPTCDDTSCSLECRGGTIDCGGGCLCQDGRCAADLWYPDVPE